MQLSVFSSRLKCATCVFEFVKCKGLATLLLYCLVSVAFAAEEPDLATRDLNLGDDAISWMPGEKYDPHTGVLNYASSDIYLPGNGRLPIDIKRVFYQRSTGSQDIFAPFGYMGLATPTVSFSIRDGLYTGCHSSGLRSAPFVINDNNIYDRSVLASHPTFSDGSQQIHFFKGTEADGSLTSKSDGGRADFISVENWRLECLDPEPKFNTSKMINSRLRVISPDGIVYRMSSKRDVGNRPVRGGYKVDTISDQYGNTLTFGYGRIPVRIPQGAMATISRLLKVTANDGRKVTIKYKDKSYNIESITTNGLPNPRVVTYEYERAGYFGAAEDALIVKENDTAIKRYVFASGRLTSIKYPEGVEVRYEYHSAKGLRTAILGRTYAPLSKRISNPNDSVYTFEKHQHPTLPQIYSRLIRTKNGAFEYVFRVDNSQITGKVDKNYFASSGKLVAYRVFSDPSVEWVANSRNSVLLVRLYGYKSLYKLSTKNRGVKADRIVIDKIRTIMNGGLSNFIKHFEEYNFRGYPTKIVDYNGRIDAGQSIATVLEYEPSDIDSLQLGKPIKVTIDGVDITDTSYSRGDVETITENGKIVASYEYYQIDEEWPGELKSFTNGQNGKTTYENYLRGQAQSIVNPRGLVKQLVINSDGTVKSTTRFGDEKVTESTYDSYRRIKSIVSARQLSRNVTYLYPNIRLRMDRSSLLLNNEFGRTQIDSRYDEIQDKRSTREFRYDSEGRTIFESIPHGLTVDETIENPSKIGHRYEYDALGRLTKFTHNGRGDELISTRYKYGVEAGTGNLTITRVDARTDGDSELETVTTYLNYGSPQYRWPISIKEANGTITTIQRNTLGNVTSYSREGMTTTFEYNAQNLVESMNRPQDGGTSFRYYDDGSLKVRQRSHGMTTYHYYPDLKIRQEDHTKGDEDYLSREFVYDDHGNLGRMITKSGDEVQNNIVTYAYDEENNITDEHFEIDGMDFKLHYVYDEWSNKSYVKYPSNNVYHLKPNNFGNPTLIEQTYPKKKTVYNSIEYHPNHVAKLLTAENGHQISMSIDSGQRPFEYVLQEYGGGRTSKLASRNYFYDKSNNVSKIGDRADNRDSVFGYDLVNQLTSASINDADNWTFSYKPSGDIDWVQHGDDYIDYKYDVQSQTLSSVVQNGTPRSFEYDDLGNIDRHERLNSDGAVRAMSLKFNAANEVVSMNDGTSFVYDARGLRLKTKKLGSPIYTLYDHEKNLIYRHDVGAGVTSEYLYVDGKLVTRRDVDVSGESSNGPSSQSSPSVQSDPRVPSLEWPFGAGITSNPEYKWKSVGKASDYYLTIEKVSGGSQSVVKYVKLSASELGCSDGSNCRTKQSDVQVSGNYRWKVMSKVEGVKSDWSQWTYFSSMPNNDADDSGNSTVPRVPFIRWPAGKTNNDNPQYEWTAVPGATSYDLDVREYGSQAPFYYKKLTAAEANCPQGTGDCTFYKKGFELSGWNTWRVRSRNSVGASKWSDGKVFNVD